MIGRHKGSRCLINVAARWWWGLSCARGERGNAAVEMAILLPLLMTLVFGAVDFARLFYANITLASAAHEAAMYRAEVEGRITSDAPIETAAAAESDNGLASLLSFSGATANTTLSQPALSAGTTSGNLDLFVTVQLTYSFKPLVPFPLKGPIPVTAVASAPTMRVIS